MSLTPVEIRHVKLKRRLAGYDRKTVDGLLQDIRASFETVWRERADLSEIVERLEGDLARFREQEGLLRKTLVSAERAADNLRAQAGREAEVMLEDARVKARAIVVEAEGERERVRTEIRRLNALEAEMRAGYRAFLLAALDRVEADGAGRESPGAGGLSAAS